MGGLYIGIECWNPRVHYLAGISRWRGSHRGLRRGIGRSGVSRSSDWLVRRIYWAGTTNCGGRMWRGRSPGRTRTVGMDIVGGKGALRESWRKEVELSENGLYKDWSRDPRNPWSDRRPLSPDRQSIIRFSWKSTSFSQLFFLILCFSLLSLPLAACSLSHCSRLPSERFTMSTWGEYFRVTT